MSRRRLGSVLAIVAVMAATLLGTATPASAATCTYLGGGLYGADRTGFLPRQGNGVVSEQTILYGLIGYAPLSSGCTTGVLDLVSHSTLGAVSTCTLVLPALPGTGGTGCGGLLGTTGAGATAQTPVGHFGVGLQVYAELTAVGADGTRVSLVRGPCSGYLDEYGASSFRCAM